MKCANCDSPALYLYDPKPLRPTAYCAAHLPSFLKQSAKAGLLPVTDAFEATRREAIAILSPSVRVPVEVEVKPTPDAEPPAPKKRRRAPKKAAPAAEQTSEETAPENTEEA